MERTKLRPLAQKAMEGDGEGLQLLCEAVGRDVLYICIKKMGNVTAGEDAAQEVFIRLCRSINTLQKADAFPVWLNRIIDSTCSNMRRGAMAAATQTDMQSYLETLCEENSEFLPAEYAEQKEKRELVIAAMERLPQHYQDALYLFYYAQLSQKDIAEVLDTSPNAVALTMRRAKGALRKLVENQSGQSFGFLALAGTPVLQRILLQEAGGLISGEMVRHTLAQSGVLATSAATAGSAIAGAAGAGNAASAAAGTVVTTVTTASAGAAVTAAASTTAAASAITAGSVATAVVSVATVAAVAVSGVAIATAISPNTSHSQPLAEYIEQSNQQEIAGDMELEWNDAPGEATVSEPVFGPSELPEAVSVVEPPVNDEQEAPAPAASLAGQVYFTNNAGAVLPEHIGLTQGCVVQLFDGDTLLARAEVNAKGEYTLPAPSARGSYQLMVQPSLSVGGQHPQQNPEGSTRFHYRGGSALPVLYVTDSTPPTGHIQFLDEAGKPYGLLNPHGAAISVGDTSPVAIQWEVTPQSTPQGSDGWPLLQGEGDTPHDFAELPASSGGTWYTLHVYLEDAAGNTSHLQRDFVLFT